jgi:hypothetical protein
VLELRVIDLAAEAFQIREPLQFSCVKRQPFGEIPGCFHDGKLPTRCRTDRPHLLRLSQPFCNQELAAMHNAGALKSSIFDEELHHVAMTRRCAPSEGLHISA